MQYVYQAKYKQKRKPNNKITRKERKNQTIKQNINTHDL